MTIKQIFFTVVGLFLLIGCSNNTTSEPLRMADDNPFNAELNHPIAYADVRADHIEEYVWVTLENTLQGLNEIKEVSDIHFENTFGAFDARSNALATATNNAFMLYWVSPDSLSRARGIQGYQKLDSLNTAIVSDKALFEKLQSFANSEEGQALTGNKKRLVEVVIEKFKQSGVNLSDRDLETYKRLSGEITELTTQYSTNMNSAEEVLVLSEEEAEGLPDNFKAKYQLETGGYEIPVINATASPVMSNAASSEVRKAYAMKFYNIASDKNLVILDSLISKRHQLGKVKGYESFAAQALVPKMAKTPERVWEFLNGLAKASKEKALKDLEELKSVRNSILNTPGDNSPINPWDRSYYNNQLLKTKYDVDAEKMRAYLPMNACLQGVFDIYQELLGFTFKKVDGPSVWSEEVTMYEVYEGTALRGQFYLDLFPRPNKETWFYAVPLTRGSQTDEGYDIPKAMLLGNFTKPTEELPSLLSFGELRTLFHEFGHIMDCMSYEGEFFILSETKADFVEAMSQIFENWIEDYDILSSFATHFETGEVFPKPLFENKQRAKKVSSGLNLQRSLRYSMYDMTIYDRYSPEHPIDTDQLWKDIDTKMGVMQGYIEGTHPQASWIHINTHPVYMYGYLWSEVYAQDMFTVFEENGLRDTATGIQYRHLILANGGQREVDEAVEEFIGRPPNNKAYIESLGLE